MGFGAFVEIMPGKEGLVRIGELADYHVPSVEDVVSVGDEVMVVVIEIDRQGRINLSRKAAMQRHLAKEPSGAGCTPAGRPATRTPIAHRTEAPARRPRAVRTHRGRPIRALVAGRPRAILRAVP